MFACSNLKGENTTLMILEGTCLKLAGIWMFMTHSLAYLLGLMIDMTEPYIFISVSMTLTFAQCHRVTRNLELLRSFCCGIE